MLGVKPLYFYENENILAISSTIKTFNTLLDFKINKKNLYEFYNFRQCLNNKTIINNVFSFQSGNFYEYELNGKLILSKSYISYYIDTYKPYDKAGSYGIRDWFAVCVNKIDGCFYNVMGFPLSRFWQEINKLR